MPTVEANGIRIGYEIRGQGHPLLLIAGVGYSRWFWNRLIPLLEDRYQIIAMDNRGAGESDKPPGPYTVPMMAADTAGLLDALGIQGAYVMGHSLGGFIAQELAISRPDLVAKLVLASTNHGGMKVIPITQEALEVMTRREGDPLDLIREEVDRRMAALTMPVLILTGDQDKVVPPGNADLMARKIPHAQVKIIPNTGHLFPFEDPLTTAAILKEFLG